ncbi:hypothetical protein EMCRGX_G008549 [Ephydatia muelleri]
MEDAPRKPAHRKPERTPERKPEEHHKPEPVKRTLKVLKQEAKEKGIKKYSKMNKEANETALDGETHQTTELNADIPTQFGNAKYDFNGHTIKELSLKKV